VRQPGVFRASQIACELSPVRQLQRRFQLEALKFSGLKRAEWEGKRGVQVAVVEKQSATSARGKEADVWARACLGVSQ